MPNKKKSDPVPWPFPGVGIWVPVVWRDDPVQVWWNKDAKCIECCAGPVSKAARVMVASYAERGEGRVVAAGKWLTSFGYTNVQAYPNCPPKPVPKP